jgi:hypothetical protein
MTRKQFALALTLCLLLAGTGVSARAARDPKPALDAYTLIAEVNALRAANGLPPYAINATLMAVAQAHSDYQASISTVTHYSADGSRPYQRALAAGYPVGGDLSLGGFYSENILAGMNISPSAAVVVWQGDAPHLNTMLSPHLTEVGAGVTDVNGYVYYTLDASTPADGSVPNYTPDPNETPDGDGSGALPTLDWIMPVITSTPNESGKVIHEVQVGQSLWGIADVYGTTVQEIRALNKMSVDELVYPGELLLIRVLPTDIPLPTPSLTVTVTMPPPVPSLTETSVPTSAPNGIWVTITPTEHPSEKMAVSGNLWTVFIIIFIALILAGLVTWLGGRD